MENKGFVSNEMYAGRLSSHNKIGDLTEGFKLSGNTPFSICIIEKGKITGLAVAAASNEILLVDCRLYQDDNASVFPFPLHRFSEAAIAEISPAAIDLVTYDVYWAAGADVSES